MLILKKKRLLHLSALPTPKSLELRLAFLILVILFSPFGAILNSFSNNFFWYYRQFCTFKYQISSLVSSYFFMTMGVFFFKKFKNYLKFSLLHITKVANYQWDMIYRKNLNDSFNSFLNLSKQCTISFISHILTKVYDVILFDFTYINSNITGFSGLSFKQSIVTSVIPPLSDISIKGFTTSTIGNRFNSFYKNTYNGFSSKNSVNLNLRFKVSMVGGYSSLTFIKTKSIYRSSRVSFLKAKGVVRHVKAKQLVQVTTSLDERCANHIQKFIEKRGLRGSVKPISVSKSFFRFNDNLEKLPTQVSTIIHNNLIVSILLHTKLHALKYYSSLLSVNTLLKDSTSRGSFKIKHGNLEIRSQLLGIKNSVPIISLKKEEYVKMYLHEFTVFPAKAYSNDIIAPIKHVKDPLNPKRMPIIEFYVRVAFRLFFKKRFNNSVDSVTRYGFMTRHRRSRFKRKLRWLNEDRHRFVNKVITPIRLNIIKLGDSHIATCDLSETAVNNKKLLAAPSEFYVKQRKSWFLSCDDFSISILLVMNTIRLLIYKSVKINSKSTILNNDVLKLLQGNNLHNIPNLNLISSIFLNINDRSPFKFLFKPSFVDYYKNLYSSNPMLFDYRYNIFLKLMEIQNETYWDYIIKNPNISKVKPADSTFEKPFLDYYNNGYGAVAKFKNKYGNYVSDDYIFKNMKNLRFSNNVRTIALRKRGLSLKVVKQPIRESVLYMYKFKNVNKTFLYKSNWLLLALRSFHVYKPKRQYLSVKLSFFKSTLSNLIAKEIGAPLLGLSKKWSTEQELLKFYYYRKKDIFNKYYSNLVKRVPTFVIPNFYKNSTRISLDLNPFLFELYRYENPYICYIPENLTIFHIFTNPTLILKFYKKNPVSLLRKLLIHIKDGSKGKLETFIYASNLVMSLKKLSKFCKLSLMSFESCIKFNNVIFNINILNFIKNTLKGSIKIFLKNFRITVDMIFLDNASRLLYKSKNLCTMIGLILKSNAYLFGKSSFFFNDGRVLRLQTLYNHYIKKNFNNNYFTEHGLYKPLQFKFSKHWKMLIQVRDIFIRPSGVVFDCKSRVGNVIYNNLSKVRFLKKILFLKEKSRFDKICSRVSRLRKLKRLFAYNKKLWLDGAVRIKLINKKLKLCYNKLNSFKSLSLPKSSHGSVFSQLFQRERIQRNLHKLHQTFGDMPINKIMQDISITDKFVGKHTQVTNMPNPSKINLSLGMVDNLSSLNLDAIDPSLISQSSDVDDLTKIGDLQVDPFILNISSSIDYTQIKALLLFEEYVLSPTFLLRAYAFLDYLNVLYISDIFFFKKLYYDIRERVYDLVILLIMLELKSNIATSGLYISELKEALDLALSFNIGNLGYFKTKTKSLLFRKLDFFFSYNFYKEFMPFVTNLYRVYPISLSFFKNSIFAVNSFKICSLADSNFFKSYLHRPFYKKLPTNPNFNVRSNLKSKSWHSYSILLTKLFLCISRSSSMIKHFPYIFFRRLAKERYRRSVVMRRNAGYKYFYYKNAIARILVNLLKTKGSTLFDKFSVFFIFFKKFRLSWVLKKSVKFCEHNFLHFVKKAKIASSPLFNFKKSYFLKLMVGLKVFGYFFRLDSVFHLNYTNFLFFYVRADSSINYPNVGVNCWLVFLLSNYNSYLITSFRKSVLPKFSDIDTFMQRFIGFDKFSIFNHSGILSRIVKWSFTLIFIVKIGFLGFIAKVSTFLNSLHFFVKKHRLNTYFTKFWNDRGFFFPLELPLFRFFFLYYSNFFFNFFETSTFLNFNSFYSKFQQVRSLAFDKVLSKDSPVRKKSLTSLKKNIFKRSGAFPKVNSSSIDFIKKNYNLTYFKGYVKNAVKAFKVIHKKKVLDYKKYVCRVLRKKVKEGRMTRFELSKLRKNLIRWLIWQRLKTKPAISLIRGRPIWRNHKLKKNKGVALYVVQTLTKFAYNKNFLNLSSNFLRYKMIHKLDFRKNYQCVQYKRYKKFRIRTAKRLLRFLRFGSRLVVKKLFLKKKRFYNNKITKKRKWGFYSKVSWPLRFKKICKLNPKFFVLNLKSIRFNSKKFKSLKKFGKLKKLKLRRLLKPLLVKKIDDVTPSLTEDVTISQLTDDTITTVDTNVVIVEEPNFGDIIEDVGSVIVGTNLMSDSFLETKQQFTSYSVKYKRLKKLHQSGMYVYNKINLKWKRVWKNICKNQHFIKKFFLNFFYKLTKSISLQSLRSSNKYTYAFKRRYGLAFKNIAKPIPKRKWLRMGLDQKIRYRVRLSLKLRKRLSGLHSFKMLNPVIEFRFKNHINVGISYFKCRGRFIKKFLIKKRRGKTSILKLRVYRRRSRKKLNLILKKTLLFFSSKVGYNSKLSSKKGFTGFFSSAKDRIDNFNLFNSSTLFSKISNKSGNLSIQNIFFKNKMAFSNTDNCFENYFIKSKYLKTKKKIPKTNFIVKKPNIIFKIKPGYKVFWRSYRNEYNVLANLNFFRQRRLTNYFLNFKKSNGLLFLRNFEFSIFSVVKRSAFFLDYTLSSVCFSLGMVFLNGQQVFNKALQLYVSDRIQVALNYTYLLQFKWFFFFVNARRIKFLSKYVKYFFNIKNTALTLRKLLINFSKKLFKRLLYCGNDIPNYLEVDFFTMTSVIIYEPFLFYEFDPILIYRIPFLSLRLYNWKYIN